MMFETGHRGCSQISRNIVAGQDGLSYRFSSCANGPMDKLVSSGERRDITEPALWVEKPWLKFMITKGKPTWISPGIIEKSIKDCEQGTLLTLHTFCSCAKCLFSYRKEILGSINSSYIQRVIVSDRIDETPITYFNFHVSSIVIPSYTDREDSKCMIYDCAYCIAHFIANTGRIVPVYEMKPVNAFPEPHNA